MVAIVLLTVATIIGASTLRSLAREHRQMSRYEYHLQAVWLAESAIERTVSQLRQNRDYAGETWMVPADEMGHGLGGTVQITVSQVKGKPNQRIVGAQADYPANSVYQTRHSTSVTVEVGDTADINSHEAR